MARNPELNYWPTRGAFYTTFQGKQHLLAKGPDDRPDGPVCKAARRRFEEIVFGLAPGMTIEDLASKYIGWVQHNLADSTHFIRKQALLPLRRAFGEKHVTVLTGFDVLNFCDQQRDKAGWTDGNVCLTIRTLKMCLNWAVEVGLLEANHLARLRVPQAGSRGLECVLEPAEEAAVLSAAKGGIRDFAQTLRDTGARPGELARAEAKNYDATLQALVFQATEKDKAKRHKTAKTGRPRIIFLCGHSIEIVERLCKQHPTGPIFRTAKPRTTGPHAGERWAWKKEHIANTGVRLRKRSKVPHFIFYSFRHTFAVRWLRQGMPVAALAEVMGTSIEMIKRHYGHLADQHDYLRQLVNQLHASREQ